MNFFSDFSSFEESLERCCYTALLGREPEEAALAARRAKKLPPAQEKALLAILEKFIGCDEYNHRVCEFTSFEEALERCCYRALLGREPEEAALAARRARRVPVDRERAVQAILERFIGCDEYKHKVMTANAGPYDGSLLPVHQLTNGTRTSVLNSIRKRCMVSYLGNSVALCRVLGRFHMFVDTTDVGFTTHVMHSGAWEMPLTEFMVKTIKPGMRVIDVGGNFGYYSLLMSDLVQHTGHCFVFEPNVAVARLLRRSLSVNGFDHRSTIFEVALSDSNRQSMQFYIPTTEPKNARLVDGIDEHLAADGRFVEVPVRSIDGMAKDLGRIDFLKIDAEGAEMAILAGMAQMIREQRPRLMVEINCARNYDPRPTLAELRSLYGNIGSLEDDGSVYDIDIGKITTQRFGEDWLIYFQ